MRLLKSGELGVVAGGLDDEFADFGDEYFSLDEVTVRGRRPKKRKGFFSELAGRWGDVFDPAKLACPSAFTEMFAAEEKLEEVVVEAKKISPEQIKDFGMLFPQSTSDGQWTGRTDMWEAWRDLFQTMSAENLEAIRQALAEMIDNAMTLGNSSAVGQLCALVNLVVKAMMGGGDRAGLGLAFGEGLFQANGKLGVSLLPLVKAFEGK
jgi:hypothetical protein